MKTKPAQYIIWKQINRNMSTMEYMTQDTPYTMWSGRFLDAKKFSYKKASKIISDFRKEQRPGSSELWEKTIVYDKEY